MLPQIFPECQSHLPILLPILSENLTARKIKVTSKNPQKTTAKIAVTIFVLVQTTINNIARQMNVQKARLLSSLLILDGCGLFPTIVLLQKFGDKLVEDFLDCFPLAVGFNLEGLPY